MRCPGLWVCGLFVGCGSCVFFRLWVSWWMRKGKLGSMGGVRNLHAFSCSGIGVGSEWGRRAPGLSSGLWKKPDKLEVFSST